MFHRNGLCIEDIQGAWERACREAGVTGKIPHDFRRTAIRNMVRVGIPKRGAMQLTGHKTRDVFDRYNLVNAGDLDEAARRIDERIAARTTTLSTTLPLSEQEQPHLSH